MSKRRSKQNIKTDVVVVGGGLAGLTTAMGLRDSGLGVVVVEREPILGGRARSWTDKETGDPVHIGPHIFLSEYPNMFKLLDMLGTRDRIVWQQERCILIVDGREEIEMRMAPLPPPLHFAPSLIADRHVTTRDLLSNLPVSLLAMRVTEHFIQRFWAFTAMSILNVPVELCSAGALLRFYRRLVGHNAYEVGFPDGGLGDVFAPAAQTAIEAAGGTVLKGVQVRSFLGDASQATGVELTDGRRIEGRWCVGAVPPQALRSIALAPWLAEQPVFRDLVHFRPSPYISTFLWFDRKLTRKQFWARAFDPNDLSCDFYDLSNIHTGWADRPSVITTNCIYSDRAQDLTDEQIVEATVAEMAEYLPEAAQAKVQHAVVNRIPMAIHCPYPGTERRRPAARTPIRGLLLAGDWLATALPSSMESACLSGWQAAEAILDDAGAPRRLAEPHKEIEGIAGAVHRLSRLARWR